MGCGNVVVGPDILGNDGDAFLDTAVSKVGCDGDKESQRLRTCVRFYSTVGVIEIDGELFHGGAPGDV